MRVCGLCQDDPLRRGAHHPGYARVILIVRYPDHRGYPAYLQLIQNRAHVQGAHGVHAVIQQDEGILSQHFHSGRPGDGFQRGPRLLPGKSGQHGDGVSQRQGPVVSLMLTQQGNAQRGKPPAENDRVKDHALRRKPDILRIKVLSPDVEPRPLPGRRFAKDPVRPAALGGHEGLGAVMHHIGFIRRDRLRRGPELPRVLREDGTDHGKAVRSPRDIVIAGTLSALEHVKLRPLPVKPGQGRRGLDAHRADADPGAKSFFYFIKLRLHRLHTGGQRFRGDHPPAYAEPLAKILQMGARHHPDPQMRAEKGAEHAGCGALPLAARDDRRRRPGQLPQDGRAKVRPALFGVGRRIILQGRGLQVGGVDIRLGFFRVHPLTPAGPPSAGPPRSQPESCP